MADERSRAFEQAALARAQRGRGGQSAAPSLRTAVPQREAPRRKPQEKPRIVKGPGLTKEEQEAERKARSRYVQRIILCALLIFSMLGSLMYMRARISELGRERAELAETLEECRSEKIRLNMQLMARISPERIERIATQELGMSKYRESMRYIADVNTDSAKVFQFVAPPADDGQ